MEFLSIELSEDVLLPKKECRLCRERLKTTFEFKNMCNKNDTLLKQQQTPSEILSLKSKYPKISNQMIQSQKEFNCEFCIKETKFCSKWTLVRHKEEKHCICKHCHRIFQTKDSLDEHYKNFHRSERQYQCEKCIKTFEERRDLTKHTRNFHKENNPIVGKSQSNSKNDAQQLEEFDARNENGEMILLCKHRTKFRNMTIPPTMHDHSMNSKISLGLK